MPVATAHMSAHIEMTASEVGNADIGRNLPTAAPRKDQTVRQSMLVAIPFQRMACTTPATSGRSDLGIILAYRPFLLSDNVVRYVELG